MFGIEKDFQQLMEQVYGPLNKDKMTDLKFTSPSGETTIKVQDTGRLGTVAPKTQLHIKMDEPVKYEKPMTAVEEIKAQIKVLQSKLSFLEELEKTKSPVEECYKDWWGEYPTNTFNSDVVDDSRWMGFQAGYEFAYAISTAKEVMKQVQEEQNVVDEPDYYDEVEWDEKDNPNENPLDCLKPQTPEETAQSLKEAFREAQQTEKWKELQRKIDAPAEGIYDNIDIDKLLKKWEENPPEFLKFELGKTLEDICMRWWDDIFTINSSWDSITSIQDFCDRVELWLPREQDASGSQDIYTVAAVEGFNDAIKKIKSKLRNKKDT